MNVLIFDIETAPITAYTWGLFDQNIGLSQIKTDWFILSWAAKWLGDPPSKTFYMDNSRNKNIQDDKALVVALASLLDQADIIITQNGDAFDVKKLNARAVIHGLPPIKPCRSTDILKEGRKVFKFTSHKLEYVSNVLNTKYKKLKHDDYPGFELWKAIMAGDKKAWASMKKYCIHDVLSTEEAYQKIQAWIKTGLPSEDGGVAKCACGGRRLESRGYFYTTVGKYHRYRCRDCGKWLKSSTNEYTAQQKQGILREGR